MELEANSARNQSFVVLTCNHHFREIWVISVRDVLLDSDLEYNSGSSTVTGV